MRGGLDHIKSKLRFYFYLRLKDSFKILIYFVAVVILGALLAPPLFWAGNAVGRALDWEILKALRESDFQRYFHRAILVAAVVLLIPLARWLHLPSWRILFAQNDPRPIPHLLMGFFIALAVLTALGFGLVHFDYWNWKDPLPWERVQKVVVTAVVVSIIEEFFFRGALTKVVTRSAGPWWALLFVSALYSVVHFLKPRETVIPANAVNWLSGFDLIPASFERFSEPEMVLAGFGTLFILGCTLGYAAWKTNGLWYSMGLHAGAILGKFGFNKLAKIDRKHDAMPWFHSDITIGYGAIGVMLLLFFLVWWSLRKAR